MGKKKKTRSQAMMGNQNAKQGVSKKLSYKELLDENELLRDYLDSLEEVLNEIKNLLK